MSTPPSHQPARVVIVRGHQITPWELRPWRLLPDRFQVSYLMTERNMFGDVGDLGLERVPVRSRRGLLPRGRAGDLAAGLIGDRYRNLDAALAGARIVHALELAYWFAAEAARHKPRHGYRLVQTVWETIPFLDTYRLPKSRANRRVVLERTDLFLAATRRAEEGLLLEGVAPERIRVVSMGIDVERFRSAAAPERAPGEHVIVSPGRLVWEKGHQDVLRAVAALRRGLVASPVERLRVLIIGGGPEEARLRSYAGELGIGEVVEFRSVPYDEMPGLFASASCMVLASLPNAAFEIPPGGIPRTFWEEQFGYVLVEAMAAGLPIVASTSGAIPEVAGPDARYFAPGDWMGLARELAAGPLAQPPGTRHPYPPERLRHFSVEAAAERIAAVYDELLTGG